jgi:hypothetical protein
LLTTPDGQGPRPRFVVADYIEVFDGRVVGLAGYDVVVAPVALDDRGLAIADHDEVGLRTPASRSSAPGSDYTAIAFLTGNSR